MAILILSNSRGKEIPYSEWLSTLKEDLYLICSEDYNLENNSYFWMKGFENYERSEDLIKEAENLLQNKKFKYLLAKAECDLIRGGLLRDKFNIPGQRHEQAVAFRNKQIMKSILSSKRIPIADFSMANAKSDAVAFAEKYKFPIIIKPIDGSGSKDTLKINSIDELNKIPDMEFSNKIIEKFIEGDMYHVDGVVINGEIKFIYPSKYLTSCLAYQQSQSLKSQLISYENPLLDRLIHFVKEAIVAMPTPDNTTFHAEVFHTIDDKLILCEIASRTGGGRIRKIIKTSFNIDIDEHWIKAQCNIFYPESYVYPVKPKVLSGWILIVPKPAILKLFATGELPSWVIEYRHVGEEGKNYKNAQKSTDCVASFVVIGDSEKQVSERLNYVENWFFEKTEWK